MPFETIDLSIIHGAGDQLWLSAVSGQGAVHGVPRRDRRQASLKKLREHTEWFREAVRKAYQDPGHAIETGRVLHDLVFGVPDVQALFQRTRGAAADKGHPLLVRVLAAPQTIASLPWELLLDPEGGAHRHLTLAPDAHVARLARVRTYPVRLTPIQPPLRMLLTLSSPPLSQQGTEDLVFDVYEEKRSLLAELQPLIDEGLLQVDVEDRPTMENLRRQIARRQRGYHILHYIGHALPEGLLLEDSSARAAPTEPEAFNALLRACPDLRLAFFAGCETAQSPAGDRAGQWEGLLSVADRCVRDAAPLVIGMQAVLPFRTERLFTRFFYQGLTSQRSVGDALTLARSATSADEYVGKGRLDWAVPCLFLGGECPDVLIAPGAPARPPQRTPREDLKLDLVEGDREFFSRHVALRRTIDFLASRTTTRVLWVTGCPGAGKTRLIGRALEDAEDLVEYVLYVPMRRLFEGPDPDPVMRMCEMVGELLTRRDSKPRQCDAAWTGNMWWERLLEEVVHRPIAIILDDVDVVRERGTGGLTQAVQRLARRRTRARLVLVGDKRYDELLGDAAADALGQQIELAPLGWDEVWGWIRRHVPVLTRYDREALAPYFHALGPHMELWSQLGEEVAKAPTPPKLSELVATIAPTKSTAAGTPTAVARQERARQATGLRVAVAGPFLAGRQHEFAEAITALASGYGGGRMASDDEDDPSAPMASLLPLPSPFVRVTAPPEEILRWLREVVAAKADVVLLDYGSEQRHPAEHAAVRALAKKGALVLAAAGNSDRPVYPGWYPEVLTVGPLEADDKLAPYQSWDADLDKPDLFAAERVAGTPLATVLTVPDAKGSSIAALHVLAAAVLVWSRSRRLTAPQVREILESTADPIPLPGSKPDHQPRRLNLRSALDHATELLVTAALAGGPMELDQLVATCGLRPLDTVRVVDKLIHDHKLRITVRAGTETYEGAAGATGA